MHSMLSDVVADQIRKRRDALGLTREQLADRCTSLGAPELTYGAITNIETGRKTKEGTRRRLVAVDELATIARALRIPPALLVFPVGQADTVEALPGDAIPTGAALAWFTGERRYPSEHVPRGELDEATGLAEWYEDPEAGWEEGAAPVALWRQHADQVSRWHTAPTAIRRENPEDAPEAELRTKVGRLRQGIEEELQRTRTTMRQLGLMPPALAAELRHVDKGGFK
ncbi:helix-turn-helix domain-containing protein [Streptomyces sp. NPDC057582]|uniref:helix-turn-helix domain-containing protein n=1 Tax=Streptomyces sp. NPDC057582 TaxID=3346174 RepID=UPI0036CB81EA